MSESPRGLAGSAALMFSGTLVSRLLGLVRNVVLVAAIGVTGAANSFAVANKLPNIIYMLVAGGVLNAILVPQIVRAMKGRDGGDEYVNRLLTMAGAALLGLSLLLTAGASVLVAVYASELDPAWFDLAIAFAVWCVPQLFFYGMYTLLGQVLNARGIFGPYMWAPAANNVIAIIGLVVYIVVFGGKATGAHVDPAAWTGLRIALIGGTATLGVAVQAAVLVVPLRRAGFRFRPRWGLRGSGLGRASKVATWAFASLLVAQLGFIAISNLAAGAADSGEGFIAGNAAWDQANFLYLLPQSLITVSLVTALFTRVSGYAAAGEAAKVRDDLSLGLRTIAVFTIFAGGALAVLALPLVQAVVPTTTLPEAEGIARIVVALLGGIAALGAFTMIQRVYYAFEDTKSLFKLQIPLTAIVIAGCLVSTLLPPSWWLVGAAVATTLSNVVGSVVAYLALRLKLPNLDGTRVLRTHIRLVIAATPALLIGWGLLHLLGPATTAEHWAPRMLLALVKVGVVGGLMLGLYLLLLRMLKVSELDVIARPVLGILRRVTGRGARDSGSVAVSTMGAEHAPDPAPGTGPHRRSTTLDDDGPRSAPALAQGTVLAGRYLLSEELVTALPDTALWRGRDEILEHEVQALVLPSTTGRSAETIDAARRAALVDDPRLERVLDVGTHEGHAFVVTDVARAPSVAELAAGGTMAPERARAIIGETAGAIEAARRRGVHHLFLSPSLVQVTDDGQVRLAGLGTAAAYLGRDDDDVTAAPIDTLSLVRLLYTALTGTWPGPATSTAVPVDLPPARQVGGGPVAPSALRDDIPGDLDSLCVRTLGPDAGGPRTPRELIRELAPWQDASRDTPARADAPQAPDAPDAPEPPADPETPAAPPSTPRAGSLTAATALAAGAAGVAGGTAGVADGTAAAGTAGTVPALETTSSSTTQATAHAPVAAGPPQPARDTSHWQPRELPEDAGAPSDFGAVMASAATATAAPATLRHPRGSVITATLAAGIGGGAAAVSTVARRATGAVGATLAGGRDKLNQAAEARAAAAEEREEQRIAAEREADIQEALERRESAAAGEPGGVDHAAEAAVGPVAEPAGTPVTDGAPEPAPEPAAAPPTWEDVVTTDEPRSRGGRIDPTPVVLVLAFIGVVVGAIFAFNTLTAEPEPRTLPPATEAPTQAPQTTEPAETGEPTGQATEEPTTEPEPSAPPVIASLAPLDPEGDGAENPDLTPRALDGDTSTFWRSRSYVDASYGMKSGIGLHVALEEETAVSAVTIDLMGQGGHVEIRSTGPGSPTDGEVLADGAMGPDSTFTFSEPVTTDSLVLWFTELPVADSDGRNRLEVAELGVE